MSVRIPWNEYETAILISACAAYIAGECTKKDAIKNVSRTLRQRAKNCGIEIDDVFRNENGIAMQFMLVHELITNERCGLRGASKMFVDMVELYKNDKVRFQKILAEARNTVEDNKADSEQFVASLSENDKNVNIQIMDIDKEDKQVYDSDEGDYSAAKCLREVSLNEEEKQLALILEEDYENGFRINSAIDRDRIKVYYHERFGRKIQLSDEQILALLKKAGVVREGRIYKKQDNEGIDLLRQIFNNVMSVFEYGATCVYPEAVYYKYHIELEEKMQIYDAEFLGHTLIEMSFGKLRKKKTFLCLKDRQADLENDVLKILKNSPMPMTYADIQKIMWYIPLDKIKHMLAVSKSIVQVEQETYFYALNLPMNEEEITEINRLIHCELENKMFITDSELRRLIDDKCPGISINTSEFTTYGLRNCLGYILRDAYSFNGAIISSLGKELSMAEIFAKYCGEREQITIEEIKALASEMNTAIYWDSIRDETIRISDEIFLRQDKVDFDVDMIDKVLNTLCDGNYVALENIGLFMHFPTLSIPWNGYVLESYVYKYSKKFKLLHASFSASGFCGAMVRKESGIEDYRALIVDVLANTNEWDDINTALEFLVNQGYQQRRKYADIGKVVHKAKLLREKINASKK